MDPDIPGHVIMPETVYLAFLNERSLLPVIWLGLRRKRVIVIDVSPLFPPVRNLFAWIFQSLVKLNLVEDPDGSLTEDEIQHSRIWPCTWPDMFIRLEEKIETVFDFSRIDRTLSESDARAVKHCICAYVDNSFFRVARLRFFRNYFRESNLAVVGITADVLGWYGDYFGEDANLEIREIINQSRIINFSSAIILGLRTVVWAFLKVRLGPVNREHVFLGADFINDPRYMVLLHEVAPTLDDIRLIFRNKSQRTAILEDSRFTIFKGCLRTDGNLGIATLPRVLFQSLFELIRLLRLGIGFPAVLSFEILKLPFYRMTYKALLERYSFSNFFGRDDYDSQHIVRTDELRRVGSRAIGINHGLPVPEAVRGVWRYLDFDLYYTFGDHLYRKYYLGTWPPHMEIKSVGSFGMSREQISRLGKKRPKDIIFFSGTMPGNDEPFQWAQELARHFPDRTVFIKHKRSREGKLYEGQVYERPSNPPSNLIDTWEDSYELMLKCQYVLSTPNSTVAAEAIQYGLYTFVWDATDYLSFSYYREFSDLCVASLEQLINRIETIEAGTWEYPRDSYQQLINFSGRPIFDVIREDLLLPYAKTSVPLLEKATLAGSSHG